MIPYLRLKLIFLGVVVGLLIAGCGNTVTELQSDESSMQSSLDTNTSISTESLNENNQTQLDLDDSVSDKKTKGYLIDSPIEGANYICDGEEGLTDSNGTFECITPPVTFKIGNLTFGTLNAFTPDGKVYPQDLLRLDRGNFSDTRLKLLARLMQSLDDDGDIETQIIITSEVRDALSEEQNFADMSESDVEALLSKLGKSLVNECGALEHLGAGVSCDSNGNYYVYTPLTTSNTQKTTITGYAEDDPMPNAKIKVTDEASTLIVETTADTNGKYTLQANFVDGKVYTLESKGQIGDRNITLHSIFKFSSDTVINVNPITELKYQLVQSGKTIEEAEALIRDYFTLVNGEKLERNRFDANSSTGLGMVDLAKLYDGSLPLDAIEKIKEDILRNSALAEEDREYAYRDLLLATFELTSSSDSLEVGQNVTFTFLGADDLNDNYIIEWVGILNDNNESTLTKSFTSSEPQDIFVSVNLYLKDDENSSNNILISTVSNKVNFYKVEEPQNIVINDGDTNVSIDSDVKINIPANALGAGEQISYSEVTTGSSDYLKVFNLEPSGTVFSEPIEIRVKYDPSQVYDPRLLTIKRVSDDGTEDILKVKRIDYANSELIFETEHFSKFWIKRHITYHKYNDYIYYSLWSRKTFDVWNDKGIGQTSIRELYVKKYSPYHYLMESLDFYCKEKNFNDTKCKNMLKYFQNTTNAEKISISYRNIFNQGENYDIFSQDYNFWYLIKRLPYFPGENSTTSGYINISGRIDEERYKMIHDGLNGKSIDGNLLPSWWNYLTWNTNIYFGIDKNIISNINDILQIKNIYDELKNEYSSNYKLKASIASFFFNKFLSGNTGIPSYIFNEAFSGLNSLNGTRFHIAFTLHNPNGSFNEYMLYLFGASSGDLSLKNENNKVFLFKDSIKITNDEANTYLKNIYLGENPYSYNKSSDALTDFYKTLYIYNKIYYNEQYRNEIKEALLLRANKIALQILLNADKVKANDLISEKQAKLNKIKEYLLDKNNKLQKHSYQKTETIESEIVTIPVLDSFDNFLTQININIPESKWDSIEVKKVSLSVDKYTIEKEASTDTTQMIFKMTSFAGTSNFSKSNIAKDDFTLVDERYSRNLASIFTDLDSSEFQDSFVVVRANILISLDGVDRVVTKEYQFINYVDSDNELISEPEYGKLTSAVRDAVTGEPISDARVTLLPIDITNNTDENGDYSFSKLPPNTYNIEVSKDGYKPTTIYDITLGDGEDKNIEVLLAIDEEYADNNGTVNITLKDAINGNVVSNGYVKVREGQNNKTGEVIKEIGDSGDSMSLELIPNTYTVEVGANGYTHSFNTITVIGDITKSYEFSITPVLSADQVRIVLSWGENPSDLDSHLVRLTNDVKDYHVYYGDMTPANADANLDTDDTDSYGPETITINNLSNISVYKYYVHNFSSYDNHNDEILKTSGAKVDIYYGDQSETFYVPNEVGNAWKVFEIVNGEIVPCTSECVFGVDGESDENIGLRKLERTNLDKGYFRNLPSK